MARLKAHSFWSSPDQDGTWRYYRNGFAPGSNERLELFRINILASDASYSELLKRNGRNPRMAELQKFLKQPHLIGEYFYREMRLDPQACIAFYFTHWETAFAMKMAWA